MNTIIRRMIIWFKKNMYVLTIFLVILFIQQYRNNKTQSDNMILVKTAEGFKEYYNICSNIYGSYLGKNINEETKWDVLRMASNNKDCAKIIYIPNAGCNPCVETLFSKIRDSKKDNIMVIFENYDEKQYNIYQSKYNLYKKSFNDVVGIYKINGYDKMRYPYILTINKEIINGVYYLAKYDEATLDRILKNI